MSTPHQVRPVSLLSPQFITGVYIPSALLLAGCVIVNIDLLPFAISLVLGLGAWKIYAASKQIRAGRRHKCEKDVLTFASIKILQR